jgi:hypothetical protein
MGKTRTRARNRVTIDYSPGRIVCSCETLVSYGDQRGTTAVVTDVPLPIARQCDHYLEVIWRLSRNRCIQLRAFRDQHPTTRVRPLHLIKLDLPMCHLEHPEPNTLEHLEPDTHQQHAVYLTRKRLVALHTETAVTETSYIETIPYTRSRAVDCIPCGNVLTLMHLIYLTLWTFAVL